MDTLLGVVGKDFVIIAADAAKAHSITVLKSDHDKMMVLGKNKLMAICGEAGDTDHFGSYIQKNLKLYAVCNERDLTVDSTASMVRNEMAEALRKHPYQANLLIGGVDEDGPQLYWIDYLGSKCGLNFAAHGYFGHYALSYFDRNWKPDMTEEEAMALIRGCMDEIPRRFIINQPLEKFYIRKSDKTGVTRIQ